MAGIIDFPQVVQEALCYFDDLFANEPQRRHFAEYLTGLFVAARKTVTGINAEFARTTDPAGEPAHDAGLGHGTGGGVCVGQGPCRGPPRPHMK